MYREQIRLFLIFIVLAVLQVLIANHIHLFHFATPLLYVYLPLVMRRGALRWAMLLWLTLFVGYDGLAYRPMQ